MAGERDAGLRALQGGDIDGAIRLLEAACAADDGDFQANLYLGAAYSQANRSDDAIDTLTRAVELQPSNAQARFNLATAMERGGYLEQAAAVYEQALMLQPDYARAADALQRLMRTGVVSAQAAPHPAAEDAATSPPQPQSAAADAAPSPDPRQTVSPAPPTGAAPKYGDGLAALFAAIPAPRHAAPQSGHTTQQPGGTTATHGSAASAHAPQPEVTGLAGYGTAPGHSHASPHQGAPQPAPYGGQQPGGRVPLPPAPGARGQGGPDVRQSQGEKSDARSDGGLKRLFHKLSGKEKDAGS